MSNGIVSIPALCPAAALPRPAAVVLVAALIAAIGGCNASTAPPLTPQPAIEARMDQRPSLGHQTDPVRNRTWYLTSEGVSIQEAGTPGKTMEVPLPFWSWVHGEYSCPPVLALGPKGEAIVTSNVVPTLWRIDPETLAVSVHELVLDSDNDKDVGFSGLVYSTEHGVFFAVSHTHGSRWQIDPLLRTGHKVPLAAPIREAASCMKPQARLAREGN